MQQAINYAFLAKKYLKAKVTMHDRTYEGLEWHGPGEKPSKEMFAAFQKEEDRQARAAGVIQEARLGLAEEKQRQAKAKALEDIRPFEDKLREMEQSVYEEALSLKRRAIETQSLLRSKQAVVGAWVEVSEAQAMAQEEAKKYLEDTSHLVSPDNPSPVPDEVLKKRKEAFSLLEQGKTVFSDFSRLRESELPSRQEMMEAIRKGGEHLKRIEELCNRAALRYPRPKRNLF